tara:strand:- start:4749 stop:5528 length:780 start_codon:yes stop_codon:yes gene_type:complete
LINPPTRVADPRAEGMAALMVDVRNSFAGELTKTTLFHWHQLVLPQQENSLMPRNLKVGQWRDSEEPMQIVSGPIGYEKVHYEAPPSNQVDAEISRFLDWFNHSNPLKAERDIVLAGPVRSAIAHLWFETIHPFDDGNGRVGRAIAETALAQDLNRAPLLSLSTIIEKDKNAYYNGLNKAKFWEKHQSTELNERQKKVLNKLFNAGSDDFEGGLSAKKYISITSCSKATATRDLGDLVEKECLCRLEGGGRNARYGLRL